MKYIGLLYWRFNQLSTGVFFIGNLIGEKEKWKDKEKEEADFLLHNTTSHTQFLYQISKSYVQ